MPPTSRQQGCYVLSLAYAMQVCRVCRLRVQGLPRPFHILTYILCAMQISIYVPEEQHPRYGVVRAVIKDTNDEDNSTSGAQQIYLDSDGLVSDNVNLSVSSNPNPMADGNWHVVTISTHADMTTGFDLYLDGAPVGDMLQGNYTGTCSFHLHCR